MDDLFMKFISWVKSDFLLERAILRTWVENFLISSLLKISLKFGLKSHGEILLKLRCINL